MPPPRKYVNTHLTASQQTCKRDLQKRPYVTSGIYRCVFPKSTMSPPRKYANIDQYASKETYIWRTPAQETYERDLQKRPVKETHVTSERYHCVCPRSTMPSPCKSVNTDLIYIKRDLQKRPTKETHVTNTWEIPLRISASSAQI